MADLRAAGDFGTAGESRVGTGAVGAGVDLVAELERVRSNLLALAAILEDLRTRYNAHTHGGSAPVPAAGEQSPTAFTAH
jgi:hypothetical protein